MCVNFVFVLFIFKAAMEIYGQALKINPREKYTFNHMGVDLTAQQKYERAISCFDQALIIDPKFTLALTNKADALRCMGHYGEAFKCFDHALEIKPKYLRAWHSKVRNSCTLSFVHVCCFLRL